MSIFGEGDWTSDFFSEFLPLFTTWQSEQGWWPSKVWQTATRRDCCFVYFTSIAVQATD